MPIATLLLREDSGQSLKVLVERAQLQRKSPPQPEYDLQLNNCHLELTLLSKPQPFAARPPQPDEGFESDVDTVSIVSSENSFTLTGAGGQEGNGSKPHTETDSANGSASSDSEQESHLVKASQDADQRPPESDPPSRNPALDSRNPGLDSRNLSDSRNPLDSRGLCLESRNLVLDSRNLGPDARNLLDSRSLGLESRNLGLGSTKLGFNPNAHGAPMTIVDARNVPVEATRIAVESPKIGLNTRDLGKTRTKCSSLDQAASEKASSAKSPTNRSPSSARNEPCKETHHLVDCLCYTDVKFPNVLVFVIKRETLVFRFDNLRHLQNLYTNFSALKAVTNQKTYNSKLIGTKFNLLQRTDNNGITHIQITRENAAGKYLNSGPSGPSSIISLNTPEDCLDRLINGETELRSLTSPLPFSEDYKESRVKNSNQSHKSESKHADGAPASVNNKPSLRIEKAVSSDNLLDINDNKTLVNNASTNKSIKNWNSVENLLDTPKRPDRRRRLKYKAPQPPANPPEETNRDILSGQFVRVNVNFEPKETQRQLIIKSHLKEPHPKKLQNFNLLSTKPSLSGFLSSKPKLKTYQEFKYSEPKRVVESSTLQRIRYKPDSNWTNSVPRLLKKPRSKSETRNFTPMAYRYIDTTQNGTISYGVAQASHQVVSNIFGGNSGPGYQDQKSYLSNSQTISNRLFGLSPKLKEFNSSDLKRDRWGSMSDICFKGDSNLKSVIKKDEGKKKNEKKVTFSAYTTVQVV